MVFQHNIKEYLPPILIEVTYVPKNPSSGLSPVTVTVDDKKKVVTVHIGFNQQKYAPDVLEDLATGEVGIPNLDPRFIEKCKKAYEAYFKFVNNRNSYYETR